MKIRMLTGISGIDFSLAPRDETERFSDDEARRLIDSGAAEAVVETPAPPPAKPHPLDHDGDGRKGGMKGASPKSRAKKG